MFDLEREVREWRRKLKKRKELEPGFIDELESHLRDSIDALVEAGISEEKAFQEICNKKIGDIEALSGEVSRANTKKSFNSIGLGIAFKNLKLLFRSTKNLGYLSLKLLILVLSITFFFGSYSYLKYEKGYDSYHSNSDRIYRVLLQSENSNGVSTNSSVIPLSLLPKLIEDIPEIETGFRLYRLQVDSGIKIGEDIFLEENFFFADTDIFKTLEFRIIDGNSPPVFENPDEVFISKRTALKYFGQINVAGSFIEYAGSNGELTQFEVKGVFENVPLASHLKPELISNFKSSINSWYKEGYLGSKSFGIVWGYVLLKENTNLNLLIDKLNTDYINKERIPEVLNNPKFEFQQIQNIHLYSDLLEEIEVGGDLTFLKIVQFASFLILLIGCLNYLILTIAENLEKTKTVAVLRVFGASKLNLFSQYFIQTFFQVSISILLSVLAVIVLLPYVSSYFNSPISLSIPSIFELSIIVGWSLIFCSLIALQPIISLSKRKYSNSLRRMLTTKPRKGFSFKNGLLMLQLVFTVFSLFAALIISKQLRFINERDLGFNKSSVIGLTLRSGLSEEMFRSELMKNPNILEISSGARVPGMRTIRTKEFSTKLIDEIDRIEINYLPVDPYFFDLFEIEVIKGRPFNIDIASDYENSVILSEAASKLLKIKENPIDQTLRIHEQNENGVEKTVQVIGVVKDLNFESLHQEAKPIIFSLKDIGGSRMMIRINKTDTKETLAFIQEKWSKQIQNIPLEYYFLEDAFNNKYVSETKLTKLIWPLMYIALFASALGLFSLVAFSVQKIQKSVCIRKILGASIQNIYRITVGKYFFLCAIVLIVTLPVAHFIMENWLSNYAYHIEINMNFYVLVSILIVLVVGLTTSYHALKTVLINPAQTLKSE